MGTVIKVLILLIPTILVALYIKRVFAASAKRKDPFTNPKSPYYDPDDQYHRKKANKDNELDDLLEKVHKEGIESLSPEERYRLSELTG